MSWRHKCSGSVCSKSLLAFGLKCGAEHVSFVHVILHIFSGHCQKQDELYFSELLEKFSSKYELQRDSSAVPLIL